MIWISVFYVVVRKFKNSRLSNYYMEVFEDFFIIVLFMYLYFIVIQAFSIFGYKFNNLFDSTLYVFYPLVNTFGPVVAFFGLVYYMFDNTNKKKLIFSVVTVIVYTVVSLIGGVRGLIVHPAFFVLFLFFIFGQKKYFKYIFLALLFFALFQSTFMQMRHLNNETKLELLAQGYIGEEKRNFIDEIEWRYGEGSRMSVAFLRRGLNNNFAGLRPLVASLYAPLPRSLFPEKPVPGSIGDDKFSMGMYIINGDMRGEWWNMTEFYSSAHAYWEFGVAGMVIVTLMSSMYLSLISVLSLRIGIFAIPIFLLFVKPWGYNEPKIWMYEIPLQIFQYVIPGSVLIVTIIMYKSLSKHFVRGIFPGKTDADNTY